MSLIFIFSRSAQCFTVRFVYLMYRHFRYLSRYPFKLLMLQSLPYPEVNLFSIRIRLLIFISYLMIIRKIASLAHTHWIQESLLVDTVPGILISTIFSVTTWAHVLSIMFSHSMRAISNFHYFLVWVVQLFITFKCFCTFRYSLIYLWFIRFNSCYFNFFFFRCQFSCKFT